jgi:hypothetical protein
MSAALNRGEHSPESPSINGHSGTPTRAVLQKPIAIAPVGAGPHNANEHSHLLRPPPAGHSHATAEHEHEYVESDYTDLHHSMHEFHPLEKVLFFLVMHVLRRTLTFVDGGCDQCASRVMHTQAYFTLYSFESLFTLALALWVLCTDLCITQDECVYAASQRTGTSQALTSCAPVSCVQGLRFDRRPHICSAHNDCRRYAFHRSPFSVSLSSSSACACAAAN